MNDIDPVMQVMNETRSLFHRMKKAAQELHGWGEWTGGERGVLFSLAELGPQTVPLLARARPVARQHIQMLVNSLLAQKLVRTVRNPEHRRSVLIALTRAGKTTVREFRKREKKVFDQLDIGATKKDLATAVRVLREINDVLSGEEWRRLVQKGKRP